MHEHTHTHTLQSDRRMKSSSYFTSNYVDTLRKKEFKIREIKHLHLEKETLK